MFPIVAAGAAFFGLELICGLFLISAGLQCDEGCEDPPEVWQDDPHAWQWTAIGIAGVVCFVAGAVALFALAVRRRRLAAWSLVPLAVGQVFAWSLLL